MKAQRVAQRVERVLGVGIPSILLVFILFSGLVALFPFTLDDWEWGSHLGVERLLSGFANHNGRYFSNVLVVILTRFPILRALFGGAVVTGILCATAFLAGGSRLSFWAMGLCLLFTPTVMRSQTLVWTSGFVNYVLPIFMLLIYCCVIRYSNLKHVALGRAAKIGLSSLGFLTSLCMENVTICSLLVSLGFSIYDMKTHRGSAWLHVAYFAGSFLGALLMASNGAYWKIAAGEDAYRSYLPTDGGILSKVFENFTTVTSYLFTKSFGLDVLLFVFLIISMNRVGLFRNKKCRAAQLPALIGFSALFLHIVLLFFGVGEKSGVRDAVDNLLCLLFFISVLWMTILLSKRGYQLLLVLSIIAVLLTGSILFVRPIWSRMIFPTYSIVSSMIALSAGQTLKGWVGNKISSVLLACVAVCFSFWVFVYGQIHVADLARIETAKRQANAGEKRLVLKSLPYEESVWCANIEEGRWLDQFKEFYGLPADVEISFD